VFKQPGTPVILEWSGFEVRAMLPHGWSLTTDQGFVPPPELASSCRVRGELHTDRNWDRFLVPALRSTDDVRTGGVARVVLKVDGHPAVSNRYVRGPFTVRDIYIDLSDLQPDSLAVWTFEGAHTTEAAECERQFMAMVQGATISRRR
jgi:hypothetical protein